MHPSVARNLKGEILELAGGNKKRLAKLVRKALRVADEAMDARKTTRVTHQGKVYRTFHDVDHATRLAASDRAHDVAGTKQGKSAQSEGKGDRIIIIAPPERFVARRVSVHDGAIVDARPLDASA
jgi:hypothetical protein